LGRFASISSTIFTSSPTVTPPASIARF
jgi:hypothetical protein